MAKDNYSYQKYQKELAKKKKADEKKKKKLEKKAIEANSSPTSDQVQENS